MTEEEALLLIQENERLKSLVSSLENQLAWLCKKMFGKMSEKNLPLNPDELQLSLFPEQQIPQEKVRIEAEAAVEQRRETDVIARKEGNPSRKPLDTSKLTVREEHIYPQGINPDEYKELPPAISELIERIPA